MAMIFDKEYILDCLKEIISVDSPSGFTVNVMKKLANIVEKLGYKAIYTEKGNLIVEVFASNERTIGLAAHVDTLGLMVRSIKADGSLAFTKIGGPILPTLDGEYCNVHTRSGKVYTGTILSNSPAAHVFPDALILPRDENNMHVRLDEKVKCKKDTLALGIETGDFICYDPKLQITESGFIKSRFLDDKLSASILLGLLKYIKDNNIKFKYGLKLLFSSYEEVGHGMSYIPEDITELIAVDMGCIGLDLNCTEYDVSICAKDSSGPYDYDITTKLINLSKENNIQYAVDIYPMYQSDVSAALKGGNNIKGGLIGPGVGASHGMERSHYEAVENTLKLLALYLEN